MKKWIKYLGAVGLLLGIAGLLLVIEWSLDTWSYRSIPGKISMGRDDDYSRAVYLFDPQLRPDSRWQRLTPTDVYAFDFAWSPDGQHLAFSCSDGISKGSYVERPGGGEWDGIYGVTEGLCLVDRNGQNFRWLVKGWHLDWSDFHWTVDGRYIVHKPMGPWERVDVQTGEIADLDKDAELLFWQTPRVPLPTIPEGIRHSEEILWRFDRGSATPWMVSPSPDGRYVTFMTSRGESDPLWLYVYDTKAERLHRLVRAKDFNFYGLVWQPEP